MPFNSKLLNTTMPRLSLTVMGGAVSLLISAAVLLGWIMHEPVLISPVSGSMMVFDTALCFALIAIAITCNNLSPALRTPLHAVVAALVMAMAALTLSEHLFAIDLGIDLPGLHLWLLGEDAHPGRMSSITALAFMLCSVVLALMHHVRRLWTGLLVQLLTTAVILTGMAGIAARILRLDLLFQHYWFSHTGLYTNAGFIVSGILLWLCWHRLEWYRSRTLVNSENKRITLTGTLVLGLVLGISGLAGFAVTTGQTEDEINEVLLLTLDSRIHLFSQNIELHMDRANLIATRPALIAYMRQINDKPDDTATLNKLQSAANSFVPFVDAITFFSPDGKSWATAGQISQHPDLTVKLHRPDTTYLMWNNGFVLFSRIPLLHDGKTVGSVAIEQSLRFLTEAMSTAKELGETGETAVCNLKDNQLNCFPQRLLPRVFNIPYSHALPMSQAVAGKTGIVNSRDYRHQDVIAAHGPIGNLGLGMVVKMDTAEFYTPIREQFHSVLALLLFMILGGTLLLRHQLEPLTKRIVDSEKRLKLALDASRLALWDWNLVSGEIYLSEQWQTMLGGEAKPTFTSISELEQQMHPDDLALVDQHLRDTLKGSVQQYNSEHRFRTRSGDWIWIRSSGQVVERDRKGRALRVSGTNTDISKRKQAEIQLAYRATHDPLTGLPDRDPFYDRLNQAMTRSRSNQTLMAVMYLDIDKFKQINDSLGHAMGDAVLKDFSQRLTSCVRSADTVARLGGDEFTVILWELRTREDGCRIAEKIMAAMRPEFSLDDRRLNITISIGIAFFDGTSDADTDTLVRKADEALYAAKGAGRNNYQVAT